MLKNIKKGMHFLHPSDPCRIQTCNPHIRSVVLYSVELMDRKEGAVRTRLELATYGVTGRYSNQLNYRTSSLLFKSGCKGTAFFSYDQIFLHFFSKKVHLMSFFCHFYRFMGRFLGQTTLLARHLGVFVFVLSHILSGQYLIPYTSRRIASIYIIEMITIPAQGIP